MRQLFLGLSLISMSVFAEEAPKDQVQDSVDRLVKHYDQIGKEIEQLKKLLGRDSKMDRLALMKPEPGLTERTKIRMEDGAKAFEDEEFDKAKEALQLAWESAPESLSTNFNLGLAYYRLGKLALAKKMLKEALEVSDEMDAAETVKAFIEGREEEVVVLSEDERKRKSEILNLKKEAESYVKSRELSLGAKVKATVDVLERMEEAVGDDGALQKEFYLEMGQNYADFEMYGRALKLFQDYEAAMDGEVLPDGYHAKLLQVEEKNRSLDQALAAYIGNEPDRTIRRHLKKDLNELVIFALQMDEFVSATEQSDSDFVKITKRLGDFKWGKHPGRHVLVVDRFSELLYSNLPGTLPVDRYQDIQGRKFLKQITQLADRMKLKDADFVELDLNVNGTQVPYVVMYTYVPKHQAFIIVRLPRQELT